MRLVLALLVALAVLGAVAAPAAAAPTSQGSLTYVAPVPGEVVDTFRPPDTRFGAGNRGIDLAAPVGAPVRASAPGEVVFAGAVGMSRHVVVLHPDGIRTTYAFLLEVSVRRGQQVAQGEQVGLASGSLHFGARVGDTYIDPMLLLAGGPLRVRLVPHDEVRAAPVAEERRGLLAQIGSSLAGAGRAVVGATADGLRWAGGQVASSLAYQLGTIVSDLRLLVHYAGELQLVTRAWRFGSRLAEWVRAPCTDAEVVPPPVPERRIAVLVGGLGSSSLAASIDALDADGLGYAEGDVVRFSYNGGRVPGSGPADLSSTHYEAGDTVVDLRESAAKLRALLEEIRYRHPGVAVDVLAHSQGGIVTRLALGDDGDQLDPRLPPIRTVVTIASPHQGSDAATAVSALDGTLSGTVALGAVDAVADLPHGLAVLQLAETSELVGELAERPLPAGANVTSIVVSGDLVVPAPNAHLPGAANTTVDVMGGSAHLAAVADAAVQREVALAVNGLAPTCVDFGRAVTNAATGEIISFGTDTAGALLGVGSRLLDRRLGAPLPVTRTPAVAR